MTPSRVRQMINERKLIGRLEGRDLRVEEESLEAEIRRRNRSGPQMQRKE